MKLMCQRRLNSDNSSIRIQYSKLIHVAHSVACLHTHIWCISSSPTYACIHVCTSMWVGRLGCQTNLCTSSKIQWNMLTNVKILITLLSSYTDFYAMWCYTLWYYGTQCWQIKEENNMEILTVTCSWNRKRKTMLFLSKKLASGHQQSLFIKEACHLIVPNNQNKIVLCELLIYFYWHLIHPNL